MSFDDMSWDDEMSRDERERWEKWSKGMREIDLILRKSGEALHRKFMQEMTERIQMSNATVGRNLVIFDLDSCISDDSWRQKLIDFSVDPADYDRYHAGIMDDSAIEKGVAQLRRCIAAGEFPVFITARPYKYVTPTKAWLSKVLGLEPSRHYWLYMRRDDDFRSSVDIKRDALATIRKEAHIGKCRVVCGYDDRTDIVKMYRVEGIEAYILDKNGVQSLPIEVPIGNQAVVTESRQPLQPSIPVRPRDASDILSEAAETFRKSNAQYKDNFRMVGDVIHDLFPNGVKLDSAKDHEVYHLLVMVVGKLTRFAVSGLAHQDSIRDLTVYAAMIEKAMDGHDIEILE